LVHRFSDLESFMSNLHQSSAAEEGQEARGEQISSLNQQQVVSNYFSSNETTSQGSIQNLVVSSVSDPSTSTSSAAEGITGEDLKSGSKVGQSIVLNRSYSEYSNSSKTQVGGNLDGGVVSNSVVDNSVEVSNTLNKGAQYSGVSSRANAGTFGSSARFVGNSMSNAGATGKVEKNQETPDGSVSNRRSWQFPHVSEGCSAAQDRYREKRATGDDNSKG
jgi:hypothetical protein